MRKDLCTVTAPRVRLLLLRACPSPISASRGRSVGIVDPQTPFRSETRWQETRTADLRPESKHLGEI